MKIAIASGKGGTGKTSLATNLAVLMSENFPVTLVDLDVEEPDTSIFIHTHSAYTKLMYRLVPEWNASKCTLCGKCQEVCNFNALINILDDIIISENLCHSCQACSILCPEDALPMKQVEMGRMKMGVSDKLTYIESRLNIGEEQSVPLISQSFRYLSETFSDDNYVLIDSPPGTSCPVIEIASEADLIILVTEPTPFGLNDLKLSVDTLKLLQREFAVVINRFGIGDNRVEEYCEEEGIPVIARIPYSRKAAELYAEGKLMSTALAEIRSEMEKVGAYIVSLKTR